MLQRSLLDARAALRHLRQLRSSDASFACRRQWRGIRSCAREPLTSLHASNTSAYRSAHRLASRYALKKAANWIRPRANRCLAPQGHGRVNCLLASANIRASQRATAERRALIATTIASTTNTKQRANKRAQNANFRPRKKQRKTRKLKVAILTIVASEKSRAI